jgi:hypothetical protein
VRNVLGHFKPASLCGGLTKDIVGLFNPRAIQGPLSRDDAGRKLCLTPVVEFSTREILRRGGKKKVNPQPSFKSRYLRVIHDARAIIHGTHPLLVEVTLFGLVVYGAYDLFRRVIGR